jgi:hypothetical protein
MGQRPGGVEPDDFRMRPVGPQERRVQLALEVPIGGVTAGSGNETKIFPARHGTFRWLSWPGFSHRTIAADKRRAGIQGNHRSSILSASIGGCNSVFWLASCKLAPSRMEFQTGGCDEDSVL